MLKTDPYGFFFEPAPKNASIVWDNRKFKWTDQQWIERRTEQNWLRGAVSVYEVHLGSWRKKNSYESLSYREVAGPLVDYCRQMNFTHVELMPSKVLPHHARQAPKLPIKSITCGPNVSMRSTMRALEILLRNNPAIFLKLFSNLASDFTAIKRFDRATVGQFLQQVGQLRIAERVAPIQRLAASSQQPDRFRIALELRKCEIEPVLELELNGETISRKPNGGLHDGGEFLRAVFVER